MINGKQIGIFANVAAGTNLANRAFGAVLKRGWARYCNEIIQPLLDDWNIDRVLWHLAGGKDNRKPMDFDGFQEIVEAIDGGQNHLTPVHPFCFQGAMADLHYRNENLSSIFYTGSIVRDEDLANVSLSDWLPRVFTELLFYKDLPIDKDRYAIGFDDFTARIKQTTARVQPNSIAVDLINDLESNGFRCLLEPHPFSEDKQFFELGSGFITVDDLWFKAHEKSETRDLCAKAKIPVHLICRSRDQWWEKAIDDEAVTAIYVPYAAADSFLSSVSVS